MSAMRRDEIDHRIAETAKRERSRLRNFIRRRVADDSDAEDILQEVFFELTEAYQLLKPVEEVSAWLLRVARNRIIDLYRKKRHAPVSHSLPAPGDEEDADWVELLPSKEAGPEAAYARSILLEELDQALEELPQEQREVFIAHEIEGRSFKELAAESGVSVNTLISRKHYAVVHLRERLRDIYQEFGGETL